jgi:hypothetical protein
MEPVSGARTVSTSPQNRLRHKVRDMRGTGRLVCFINEAVLRKFPQGLLASSHGLESRLSEKVLQ